MMFSKQYYPKGHGFFSTYSDVLCVIETELDPCNMGFTIDEFADSYYMKFKEVTRDYARMRLYSSEKFGYLCFERDSDNKMKLLSGTSRRLFCMLYIDKKVQRVVFGGL